MKLRNSRAGSDLLLNISPWVKDFRINPEIIILRLTFHRKSASKY